MSVGPGMMIEQVMEMSRNNERSIGYITVHPDLGVFLGIKADHSPVFKAIDDINPEQLIPTISVPELTDTLCADEVILDCYNYKVDVTENDQRYTRAGNVIKDGKIQHTDKDDMRLTTLPNNNFLTRTSIKTMVPALNHVTNAARYLYHHFSKASKEFDPTPSFGAVYKELETDKTAEPSASSSNGAVKNKPNF